MLSKNQLKLVRALELKKNRKREGLFVAEGPKVVGDLIRAGYKPHTIFSTTECQDAQIVTPEELHRLSFLQHPQEVLAVLHIPQAQQYKAEMPEGEDSTLPQPVSDKLALALDGVQDPGNVGPIIRIADWFGIDTI